MRVCSKCMTDKPEVEFYPRRDGSASNRNRSWCKLCYNASSRANWPKRKDRHREAVRRRETADPEGKRKLQAAKHRRIMSREQGDPTLRLRRLGTKWKHKYGLTAEGRRAMYTEQNGCCACCREPIPFERSNADHSHAEGNVRALLCMGCNCGIGNFKEDPLRLRLAAEYCEKWNNKTNGTPPCPSKNYDPSPKGERVK